MANSKLKIAQWAEEDRPREKMLNKGAEALSNAELIAILIGSGNKDESAVQLSQRILHYANNNLNTLGKIDLNDLIENFTGIGEAKAITIAAAMELGRRRKLSEAEKAEKIESSKHIYNMFHPIMSDLKHEEAWIVLLNSSNKIISKLCINKGSNINTLIDIKYILKKAIDNQAAGIILCHNHPTNDTQPSKNDDRITSKLYQSAQLMDIELIDHIIICDGSYYSYLDDKKL